MILRWREELIGLTEILMPSRTRGEGDAARPPEASRAPKCGRARGHTGRAERVAWRGVAVRPARFGADATASGTVNSLLGETERATCAIERD